MADIKITDLAAYTDPVSTDVLPIVDVGSDLTKKVSIADLLENAGTGSASAPSFSFDDDNNTGIYRPGADQVALTAGGTQALLAESTGITIPGNLTVSGTTTTIDTTTLVVEDKNIEMGAVTTPTDVTADGGGITLKGATDKTINWVNATGCWTFNQPTNFNDHVRIDSSGNVGIGTTSPARLLDVNDSADFAVPNGEGLRLGYRGQTKIAYIGIDANDAYSVNQSWANSCWIGFDSQASEKNILYRTNSNHIFYGVNGAERLRIDSSGNVGIGTTAPQQELHVQSGAGTEADIRLSGDAGASGHVTIFHNASEAGIWNASNTALRFATNSTERLRIDSSGNVGIGTDSPQAKLDVRGNCQIGSYSDLSSAGLYVTGRGTSNERAINIMSVDGNGGGLIGTTGDSTSSNGLAISSYRGGGHISFRAAGPDSSDEKVRIDSSGNVGIGTSAPGNTLHLAGTNGVGMRIENTSNSINAYTTLESTGALQANISGTGFFSWVTGGSEKARIDSSGRLLVGTASALNNLQTISGTFGAPYFQIVSGDQFGAHIAVNRFSGSDIAGAYISLTKSYTATVGNSVLVPTNSLIGRINFSANDDTNYITAAQINAYTDGETSTGDMPGRLVFSTTADGASSPTERMRITKEGYVHINGTTNFPGDSNTATGCFIEAAGDGATIFSSRSAGRSGHFNRNADGELIRFNRSGSDVGSIDVTTSATAYNTSSDYRLKENVVSLTGAADRVNQLQVHRFNFIADPDKTVDGFIAHEAQSVVPECATGTKDEVDDEGNPVYQGIDQSKLVPLLTAALQEAIAKIETLEQRLTDAGIA